MSELTGVGWTEITYRQLLVVFHTTLSTNLHTSEASIRTRRCLTLRQAEPSICASLDEHNRHSRLTQCEELPLRMCTQALVVSLDDGS